MVLLVKAGRDRSQIYRHRLIGKKKGKRNAGALKGNQAEMACP